jgi:hypothetical protein
MVRRKSVWKIPDELTSLIKKECEGTLRGALTTPRIRDFIQTENLMEWGAAIALKWKLRKQRRLKRKSK